MELGPRYILVFLVVLVVSGGVLFITFDAHRSEVTENVETAVTDRAETMATYLDNQLREQQRVIEFVGQERTVGRHGTGQQTATLQSFVETTSFDGVSVVNESGTVQALVTSDEGIKEEMVGENLSDRMYVQRGLDGEQYITSPFLAETGNYIIVISAPVVVDGEVVGTVNGAYHLNETRLFGMLGQEDPSTGVTVEAGDEQLYSDADQFDETISARAGLQTVDWTVTAHQDKAAVDRTVDQVVLFQGLLGVVLLGALGGFGGWVYRAQISRISRLVDRLGSLERREYEADGSLGGAAEWDRIETALTQLRESLSRREQMLLVHNRILRHNLRNKLNVIQSRAEILESNLDEEGAAEAASIRTTAADLLTLADRARTTETLLDPQPEDALRTDVAAEAHNRATVMEEREPSLTVTVSAPEPVYAACGTEIGTVIEELLQNVADHAGPEPTATVTVAAAGEHVVIRVEDDGDGIPEEQAQVVFGEADITQMRHTLGVGLWLVDWIVARYDGTLRVPHSEETGGVVEIELPRADDRMDDPGTEPDERADSET
jgi:signal transduction histidine kinase